MPWTDWKFVGAETEQGTGNSWSFPNRVETDDGTFATTTAASRYLMMSGLGFGTGDLPFDSIITSVEIEAEIRGYVASASGTITYYVGLHEDPTSSPDTSGQQTGTYTMTSTTLLGATSDYPVFSGLFGISLSKRADITSSSFGPWIKFESSTAGGGTGTLAVDYVKVRVLYQRPSGYMIGDI